jgi:hypothetical protein
MKIQIVRVTIRVVREIMSSPALSWMQLPSFAVVSEEEEGMRAWIMGGIVVEVARGGRPGSECFQQRLYDRADDDERCRCRKAGRGSVCLVKSRRRLVASPVQFVSKSRCPARIQQFLFVEIRDINANAERKKSEKTATGKYG